MTYLPSRPASGDVLTWKFIDSVGSSTVIGGSASGVSTAASVVPIVRSSMPVTSTMSPAIAVSTGTRSRPWKPEHLRDLRLLAISPVASGPFSTATSCPGLSVPRRMRPMPMRPDVARVVERGDLQLQRAVGVADRRRARAARIVSNSGFSRCRRPACPASRPRRRASPSRSAPRRRRPGSRAASSVAPSLSNRSNVWLTTQSGARARPVDLVDDDDRLQAELRAPSA